MNEEVTEAVRCQRAAHPSHTALLPCPTSSSTSACRRASARVCTAAGPAALQNGSERLCACGLASPSHLCHPTGMDTSSTPRISPVLEPETMAALMLRYALSHEEAAHQYAHALLLHLSTDVDPEEAAQLARDIVIEATNDIRDLEGEEVSGRIDVALRRLIDRVEAELDD